MRIDVEDRAPTHGRGDVAPASPRACGIGATPICESLAWDGATLFLGEFFGRLMPFRAQNAFAARMQGRQPRRYGPWQHHSCTPPPHRGSVSRGCGRSPAVTTTTARRPTAMRQRARLRWRHSPEELATAIGAPCSTSRHRHGLASFPGASPVAMTGKHIARILPILVRYSWQLYKPASPICLVDDAVFNRGHSGGVDVAGRPKGGTSGNRPGNRGPWRPEVSERVQDQCPASTNWLCT